MNMLATVTRAANALRAATFLSAAVVGLTLLPASASADTPEEVLEEIVGKIKSEANTSPIVEYVDWQTAYAQAPADQKALMQIQSADELKEFYREMLKNPSAMMKKHVEKRMGEATPDQKAMIEATMQQMEAEMKKKEGEMKERISGTTYTVGESKVEGDQATVQLTTAYEGKEKTHDVHFVKADSGKWLLASPGFAMESKAPSVAPGHGAAGAPGHGAMGHGAPGAGAHGALPQGHPPIPSPQ